MITAYYSNSITTTSDYTYDSTASGNYERCYEYEDEDEDDLFYIPTISLNDFNVLNQDFYTELKRFDNAKRLKQLAKLSRPPMLPHTFCLAFVKPLIKRKICRCNRHGIGLRIRG